MLDKVEIRTDFGAILSLPLNDISGGYSVRDIDGLDPVQANIVTSNFARLDGEHYQSARREKRNLVFKLGLEPDYVTKTVRDLRNDLYQFFMPKKYVTLRFYVTGEPAVEIKGMVETFECPLFSADPEASISLLCFDPDFYNPSPVVIPGGTVSTVTDSTIFYGGNVDTGLEITINVNRSITAFSISHRVDGDSYRNMSFEESFLAGDVINISTIAGNKFVTRTRAGYAESVLYALSPESDWTKFQPGINYFRIETPGATIPYTITYTEKYGGL